MRQVEDQLGGSFRSFAGRQVIDQLFGCPQRPQAQGNHLAGIGKDTHRNHVFRLCAWIQVDPTQEQQQRMLGQRQYPWTGVLLQQQVASELTQAAFAAQPGLRLRMTAIPMQPEAFLLRQLKLDQLLPSYRASAAPAIQDKSVHQSPLRVVFLVHPYSQ
ncbi:hypothetical protein D9M68_656540 [compost metagenome]